jgi:hypothetical protein
MSTIYRNGVKYCGSGGGTSDYTQLTNLPSVNNVTLTGNKTSADLGLANAPTVLTQTLTAGQTGLTFSSASILANSIIDIYTDTLGVNPTGVTSVSGSVTLTFDAQVSNVVVKVIVNNY